ncbi:hypothetical protein PV318_00100 [Streptomyces sp. ME02-6991-2B]|nr:hypothetical protein [Streptomyces sp. ME02-6991-2B]
MVNSAPDEREWQEIAALPHLRELCISEYDLNLAVPMPSVTYLRLLPDASPQLDLIPDLFPNLKRLFISGQGTPSDVIDITPLSQVSELQISISNPREISGMEHFAQGSVGLYPRPRTAKT